MRRLILNGLVVMGALAVLSRVAAAAPAAVAASTEITATGQAAIVGTDAPTARDHALDDALRKAVEQAVGTMVSSQTVTANFQLISDKIFSKSKGYVSKYNIVKEGKTPDGIYEVTIKGIVATGNLDNDLEAVLAVLKGKNMPRVLIMVTEQNIGQPVAASWWTPGKGMMTNLDAVENAFINTWQPKGISFVDRQAAMGKFRLGTSATSVDASDSEVKEFAGKTGAEIVVIGKAVATDMGPVMGSAIHSVRANISVRALELDTGHILATVTDSFTAGHIDPTTAGIQALTKAGEKVAGGLLDKMLSGWQSDLGGAATVSLKVRNIVKMKQATELVKALEAMRGVQAVRQRNFADKVVELEVEYKGTAQLLSSAIEAQKLGGLQLEVDGLTANTINAAAK